MLSVKLVAPQTVALFARLYNELNNSVRCLLTGDWAAVLRAAGGQDADRDSDQGHVAERQ